MKSVFNSGMFDLPLNNTVVNSGMSIYHCSQPTSHSAITTALTPPDIITAVSVEQCPVVNSGMSIYHCSQPLSHSAVTSNED